LGGMGGIPREEQSTGASRSSLASMPLSDSSMLRVDCRPKDPRHSAITARARKAAGVEVEVVAWRGRGRVSMVKK
jgi:hypothetical protein